MEISDPDLQWLKRVPDVLAVAALTFAAFILILRASCQGPYDLSLGIFRGNTQLEYDRALSPPVTATVEGGGRARLGGRWLLGSGAEPYVVWAGAMLDDRDSLTTAVACLAPWSPEGVPRSVVMHPMSREDSATRWIVNSAALPAIEYVCR
jgi:hypothetical protein